MPQIYRPPSIPKVISEARVCYTGSEKVSVGFKVGVISHLGLIVAKRRTSLGSHYYSPTGESGLQLAIKLPAGLTREGITVDNYGRGLRGYGQAGGSEEGQ